MMTYPFQTRVEHWLYACFGTHKAEDKLERQYRFLEEALELVQACGLPRESVNALADYVYSRPVGLLPQEIGGVMITLAALCGAYNIDMSREGDVELRRCWHNIDQIRRKQDVKPNNVAQH